MTGNVNTEWQRRAKAVCNRVWVQIMHPRIISFLLSFVIHDMVEESTHSLLDKLHCELCHVVAPKYRCPRCAFVSCSVACCQAHKRQFHCNGKRDRTKYIKVKEFTDQDLRSGTSPDLATLFSQLCSTLTDSLDIDYFLLEEMATSANQARRQMIKGLSTLDDPSSNKKRKRQTTTSSCPNPNIPMNWVHQFSKGLKLLVSEAHKRGVELHLLSPGMSRRVANSSYFLKKQNQLLWRLEWKTKHHQQTLVDEKASDDLKLGDVWRAHHDHGPVTVRSSEVLLRKEFVTSRRPQYYRLQWDMTIGQNLQRKALVEFPTFVVIPHSELEEYDIVSCKIEDLSSLSHVKQDEPEEEPEEVVQSTVENLIVQVISKSTDPMIVD